MAKKPPKNIQDLFKDLYDPGFKSEDIDFKSFYHLAEKQAEDDVKRSFDEARARNRSVEDLAGDAAIKKPLTREESLRVEDKKVQIRERAIRLRNGMADELRKIDNEAVDWSHTFDLSKRPRLRKAIKRVFGYSGKETITYDEFKSLLMRKKQLEVSEAADMMKPEDEDESNDDGSGLDIIKNIIGG